MTEQPYESEGLLQKLLADYPDVLAGDQFLGTEPKRWLLMRREAGIPAEEAGSNRWSLDHLFVDQTGIPTLVEVKRSSNTQIRREVIGQMFEYAANAVVYWPEGLIRSRYESDCEVCGNDPDEQLANFLRLGDEPGSRIDRLNGFWAAVDSNLRAGRIRIVFVADVIPPELRRIVEFLNLQMNPAEVLAIEIRQFRGAGVTTLVPTVIGQTAQATAIRESKAGSTSQWDSDSFLEKLTMEEGERVTQIAQRLLQWCETVLPVIQWGKGSKWGSCSRGLIIRNGRTVCPISIWTNGTILVQFEYLMAYVPFDSEASRLELLNRLNQIPGLKFPTDSITRRPVFPLAILENPEAEAQFHSALEWVANQIKNAERLTQQPPSL